MLEQDLQHPEITWAERTGYPSFNQPKSHYCGECGKCLDDEIIYEDENHDFICKDCLLFFHEKDWGVN